MVAAPVGLTCSARRRNCVICGIGEAPWYRPCGRALGVFHRELVRGATRFWASGTSLVMVSIRGTMANLSYILTEVLPRDAARRIVPSGWRTASRQSGPGAAA